MVAPRWVGSTPAPLRYRFDGPQITPGEDDGGLLHDTYLSRDTAQKSANAFGRPSAIHRAEVRDGSARPGDQLWIVVDERAGRVEIESVCRARDAASAACASAPDERLTVADVRVAS